MKNFNLDNFKTGRLCNGIRDGSGWVGIKRVKIYTFPKLAL